MDTTTPPEHSPASSQSNSGTVVSTAVSLATSVISSISASTSPPTATPSSTMDANDDDNGSTHRSSPVVAFIIGLSIIILASILNAGGLNLTKLDHVRTSAIPKASRRKDWQRPLWLLGMLLYILSQLIGSTLALEYLRAEYVAPLGSMSLIFNFLFASMLVGTPVTSTDIYGTVVVILGVIGIVLFGSINSGLESDMDLPRLKQLWGRANWIVYFVLMSLALTLVFNFVSQLDAVLSARSDLSAEPFAASGGGRNRRNDAGAKLGWLARVRSGHTSALTWLRVKLEVWTAAKHDKALAWTLGIGWACCGGGLAGGCLVFAKACVKLISGTLSHQNTGNQFIHIVVFLTFILLAVTAVFQIICLNRGLKVYDSTLVVPVFYGVYTASGFLNSLIFNNEVDSYKTWTLFLITLSILVLISGVVLLTHKKPEQRPAKSVPALASIPARRKGKKIVKSDSVGSSSSLVEDEEITALRETEEGNEGQVVWEVGDASDDEEDEFPARKSRDGKRSSMDARSSQRSSHRVQEGDDLMHSGDGLEYDAFADEHRHRHSHSSERTVVRSGSSDGKGDDEFGDWQEGNRQQRK